MFDSKEKSLPCVTPPPRNCSQLTDAVADVTMTHAAMIADAITAKVAVVINNKINYQKNKIGALTGTDHFIHS